MEGSWAGKKRCRCNAAGFRKVTKTLSAVFGNLSVWGTGEGAGRLWGGSCAKWGDGCSNKFTFFRKTVRKRETQGKKSFNLRKEFDALIEDDLKGLPSGRGRQN